MFPAPRGLIAWFTYAPLGDGKARNAKKPIVAFDEDGAPCIVPWEGKALVRADADPNYECMAEATYPPYDALLPAGGWRIEKTAEDGTTWSDPLVGWGARSDGVVVPLDTDSLGRVIEPPGNFRTYVEFRIYHPDQAAEQEATKPKEAD